MTAAVRAAVETRRNGTSAAALPVMTAEITLDAIGYLGWKATVQTNVYSSVYDALMSFEEGQWWPAFGKIVLEWNFRGPDGHVLPLPRELASEKDLDLPIPRGDLLTHFIEQYIDAVKAARPFPKALGAGSETTSRTSAGSTESA